MKLTEKTLAQMIDHTELKPNCTQRRLEQLCREAIEYGFWSVCINPVNIPPAVRLLEGSSVKVCSVVGFPRGAT
ncbi:MAG: 2-deoxyribose-5-phosphate aldolase, partial [Candidatus Thorarchaeota archaeon]